jgi:hypothetical protein
LCGTFEILSAPGKGTKLFVAVPQEKIVEEVQQITQDIEPHRHENMTRGSL